MAAKAVPLVALLALAAAWGRDLGGLAVAVIAVLLIAAVLAAVHHAEVVAHRVGEPFGAALAVAVTVIEVGLIVSLMAAGGEKAETLARDTVFAAVVITCAGIVGLWLLVATARRRRRLARSRRAARIASLNLAFGSAMASIGLTTR